MRINARDVIRALEKDGWREAQVTGGHRHFKHPHKPGPVTVPAHGGVDITLMVLKSIESKAASN